MTPSIVGFGESLVRLAPPGHATLAQADQLHVEVGGAEMNAVISAAAWGARGTWLTRLARNPLGRRIAAHAVAHGISVVADWDDDARTPLYFVERGARPRPSEVLYDRGHSPMAAAGPDTFDWDAQVAYADAVLCTGITCALGDGPVAAARALLAAGRRAGATTVFDVNHRSRMWSWEAAAPVLRDVLPAVDVLSASRYDLLRLLDEEADDVTLARRAIERFGHQVVLMRDAAAVESGRGVAVTAMAVTADQIERSATYDAEVVDALGAGDAALGAFVASRLADCPLDEAVDRAAWACAVQHTFEGDAWAMNDPVRTRADGTTRRILR